MNNHIYTVVYYTSVAGALKKTSVGLICGKGYRMRRTKIVCTIGPATNSDEKLEQLVRAGMNVARLNFSHGMQDEHALVIDRIQAISARLGCSIAILQDLQGQKIRTVLVKSGQSVELDK